MNVEFLVSCGISIATLGSAWGVMTAKSKEHDKEIKEIKTACETQIAEVKASMTANVNYLQQQINTQSTNFTILKDGINELNTKMDLLLKGQLIIPKG